MTQKVADVRANLNENIVHAAEIIGRSAHRRRVFEAIYRGKSPVKSVDDIVAVTNQTRMKVLQMGDQLHANGIVEKTTKDGQTAYRKDEFYTKHKNKVLSIVDNPSKSAKYPTKQKPKMSGSTHTYRIEVKGKLPKAIPVTVDDIDSFKKVRSVNGVDPSIKVNTMLESAIKKGLQKIIGESNTFKDWGGEKNDLFTNKLVYKGKRRTAAFALKGRATKGTLTPKKMGKNGDQIARLVGSDAAEVFFIVYHGKIDESVVQQLRAFAIALSIGGPPIYYCVIDGDDLNRLCQAYRRMF